MSHSSAPTTRVEQARTGDRRILARAISAVEDGTPEGAAILAGFSDRACRARRIGITGAPGVGKSTLVSGLTSMIREQGHTVGVIAVDPSSPLTGGAILGDRIRMQRHVDDPGVYVRSVAARGHLGGLSAAVPDIATVLDGAGFGVIIVETVGVGQSEVEVMHHVNTTVVVVTPGWGDSVQTDKAGLLEIGHIFVINKADRPGAAQTRRDLQTMLAIGPRRPWTPPVLETVATDGTGLGDLWNSIQDHAGHLEEVAGAQSSDPVRRPRI